MAFKCNKKSIVMYMTGMSISGVIQSVLYLTTDALMGDSYEVFSFSSVYGVNLILVLVFFALKGSYVKQILEQVDDFSEDRVRNLTQNEEKTISITQLAVREILGLFVVSILNNTISAICFPFFVGINSFPSLLASYAGFSLVFFASEALGKYWARISRLRLREGFVMYIAAMLRLVFVVIYFYIS